MVLLILQPFFANTIRSFLRKKHTDKSITQAISSLVVTNYFSSASKNQEYEIERRGYTGRCT
jgi:hypothetical protein